MSLIVDALFSRATREVLGAIFAHPNGLHLRALVSKTGLGSASTQRELTKLSQAGILKKEELGRLLVYKPNPESPVYPELKSLLAKTIGIAPQIADLLRPYTSDIEQAFIYGSVARSEDHADSDVDILVIAPKIGSADLYPLLLEAEKTFDRKISLKVYRPSEFRKKLAEGNHFLSSVMSGPRLELVGAGNGNQGTGQSAEGGSAQGGKVFRV